MSTELKDFISYPLELPPTAPLIFIINKIDLLNMPPAEIHLSDFPCISLSAKIGVGIALLTQQIKTKLGITTPPNGLFLARRRHLDALNRAYSHVNASMQHLQSSVLELAAEELRLTQRALNEITGEFSSDDLLGAIFSSFCIGK